MIDSESGCESCSIPGLLITSDSDNEIYLIPGLFARKTANESESENSDIESKNENTIPSEVEIKNEIVKEFWKSEEE